MKTLSCFVIALSLASPTPSAAHDFLINRDCSIAVKGRAPLHTICTIQGGMQGGGLDVSIRTPDGHIYSLEGPIDMEGGNKFLLQNHAARKTSSDDAVETCYARTDGILEICATATN
jgi:hypothetical protein